MASVRNILEQKTSEIWTVEASATIKEALQLMDQKNIGAVPVMEKGEIVGIFSERDFSRYAARAADLNAGLLVRDLMVHPVFFVDPDQTLDDCMNVMTAKKLRHLPVMEDERLIGLVSIGDVVNMVIAEKESTIEDLEHFLWVNMI